ncbi:hypothetical protein BGX27_009867 [Mortierella sp. AM989]|nr:hypothetical protein BGX27_009867 [Mortierella sp. AM989]
MAWRCSGTSNSDLVNRLADAKLIVSDKVKQAMLAVDRGNFSKFKPYEASELGNDAPQTIGYNSTISAPHMHAAALETLSPFLFPGARALDIGSGSGYLTVCMAQMVGPQGHVIGVEHIPELVDQATKNTMKDHPEYIQEGRVAFHSADGRIGFPQGGHYDAIHVGAAADTLHKELLDQLKAPGRMFIPVCDGGGQAIFVVDKDEEGQITKRKHMDVWAKEGVAPTKRYGHTAVLWNQNIIIFGGSNEHYEYRNDVIVFSLKTKTWSRPVIRGEVPARYLHSATVYKNKMYVYGGFAKNSKCTYVLEELRMLNLETWTWSEAYSVPARYNHSASLVGNKLWIYAGKDETGNTVSDLHSIDLTTLRVLPHSGITGKVVLLKSQHFSEAIGNQLVVFGKYPNESSGTSLYGLWIMDLDQLEWRKLDIDRSLEDGVWNYFTIVTKRQQNRLPLSGDDVNDYSDSLDDADDGSSTSSLVFLGNTEKERPQPYDHFRDVLSINVEYLGVFQIPPSTLQSHMSLMLNNEEFSDFTIVPQDSSRKIHVHRMILSSRWPHFRNMHASGMIESTKATMVLPEPYPVVYAFLSFLYMDTVDIDLDCTVLCDVMVMANMYLLERLKKLCASILHRHHLQIDTCVRIFQAACVSQEHGLKKLTQEFIFRHCGAVMKTEDWFLMWSQGGDGSSGEQRAAALDEFIEGIPDDAGLEVNPGSRNSSDGYTSSYDGTNFEPMLRKDV